jgi:hypothetical protein
MSRQSRITEGLDYGVNQGKVTAWIRDRSLTDPNRVRWMVFLGGRQHSFTSGEAESFILGLSALDMTGAVTDSPSID